MYGKNLKASKLDITEITKKKSRYSARRVKVRVKIK